MLEFDEENHIYRLDGHRVPGVTDVIREAGLMDTRWFTDEARARGSYVAIATELVDKGGPVNPPESIQGYLEAWRAFIADTSFEATHIERPLASECYGYAGKPDRVGMIAGEPIVIDIKTGSPFPHYPLQTAAYARLLDMPHKRMCVYLADDGKYKMRHHTSPRDWNTFAAALKVVHWKQENL